MPPKDASTNGPVIFHLFKTGYGSESWDTYCGVDWITAQDGGEDVYTMHEWRVNNFNGATEPCEKCLEEVCPLVLLSYTEL